MHRSLSFLLTCSLIACALAGAAPLFADAFWLFELPGHFRFQLSVVAVLTTLGFIRLRAWRHVALSVILTGLLSAPVLSLWIPSTSASTSDRALRLFTLNVGRDAAAVTTLIREQQPDIVGLVDVRPRLWEKLATLDALYPYRVVEPRGGSGLALLSRFPLENVEVHPLLTRRFLVADLDVRGRRLAIALVHPNSPRSGSRAALRNRQLEALAAFQRERPDRDVVMIGDFNTSPWSLAFQRFLVETRLRDAATGFGYRPTWPAQWPLFGIPIDHCLVSNGIEVHDFRTAGPSGSDHLAIYAEISFGHVGEEVYRHGPAIRDRGVHVRNPQFSVHR